MMKSDNKRGGIFISVLCTFMVIILCFSIFSSSGRNYFDVVTGFYQYCAGLFSTLDAIGLTPRVSVYYVDSFRYGDADKGFNYYLVFHYPKCPPRFLRNPSLIMTSSDSDFLAKFKATPTGGGEFTYSYEWIGTVPGGKIRTRDVFGKQYSEANLVMTVQRLSESDFKYIGLYTLYFDGITFLIKSQFGSDEFTYSGNSSDSSGSSGESGGLAGGR